MTNAQLLHLYAEYCHKQGHAAGALAFAMTSKDQHCWKWLFLWAEARYERDQIWKRLQDRYFDAIMLREGHQ